jgi:hypothetical protein
MARDDPTRVSLCGGCAVYMDIPTCGLGCVWVPSRYPVGHLHSSTSAMCSFLERKSAQANVRSRLWYQHRAFFIRVIKLLLVLCLQEKHKTCRHDIIGIEENFHKTKSNGEFLGTKWIIVENLYNFQFYTYKKTSLLILD